MPKLPHLAEAQLLVQHKITWAAASGRHSSLHLRVTSSRDSDKHHRFADEKKLPLQNPNKLLFWLTLARSTCSLRGNQRTGYARGATGFSVPSVILYRCFLWSVNKCAN